MGSLIEERGWERYVEVVAVRYSMSIVGAGVMTPGGDSCDVRSLSSVREPCPTSSAGDDELLPEVYPP